MRRKESGRGHLTTGPGTPYSKQLVSTQSSGRGRGGAELLLCPPSLSNALPLSSNVVTSLRLERRAGPVFKFSCHHGACPGT